MDPLELAIHIEATAAFIEADASEVLPHRAVRTPDGAGGFTTAERAVENSVTVRMIPRSDRTTEIATVDGRMARPEFAILALPGADLQELDTFDWDGDTWQIAHMHHGPDYELKGDVVRHAKG